jgi:hypothetical protein
MARSGQFVILVLRDGTAVIGYIAYQFSGL